MTEELFLFVETDLAVLYFVPISRVFLLCFSVLSENFPKQVREARIFFTGCKSDWDANQTPELLYQDRSVHRCLDLH